MLQSLHSYVICSYSSPLYNYTPVCSDRSDDVADRVLGDSAIDDSNSVTSYKLIKLLETDNGKRHNKYSVVVSSFTWTAGI